MWRPRPRVAQGTFNYFSGARGTPADIGALGRLGEADQVLTFFFRHLTVQRSRGFGARRVNVATDGKISGISLPLEFRVSPQPLMLIHPTAVASERASP